MYRRNRGSEPITLEFIDAKFDRFEAKWERDRKEEAARHEALMEKMEARIAAERKEAEARQQATEARLERDCKEAEARLAADRKEAEARLAADRKEAEMRLEKERREFKSTHRWLIMTFFAVMGVLFALGGLIYTLSNNGYFSSVVGM